MTDNEEIDDDIEYILHDSIITAVMQHIIDEVDDEVFFDVKREIDINEYLLLDIQLHFDMILHDELNILVEIILYTALLLMVL